MKPIPYIVFESELARSERHIRRMWILCIILIVLLVGSNALWIWYENQFVDSVVTTQEITQDVDSGDGGDAIINDGVHINGESKADGENNDN